MRDASAVLADSWSALRPPPRLQLSDWADDHFYLSAESAAEPGRWSTLPYQREPMNAITDPRIEEVVFMKSARVGYTKMLNATVGYHIDHDPCAMMLIQPTEDDAKGYAKEEIAPMLRDCPTIGAKLIPAKNGADALLHKRFRGGAVLHLVGARSPANFRRVSRRVIMGDEVDGYPVSAGNEGDPVALAKRRAEQFWNRKFIWGSTPTIAGASRIEQLFLQGDQRRYYVPCPHCGFMQVLQFKQLRWPKGEPSAAVFVCLECGSEIDHAHKRAMVSAGEWRPGPHAQFPDAPAPTSTTHASFHVWAAYSFSPNATWGQLASEFVEAHRAGVDQLKTFVNTVLGEPWQGRGEAPDWERLYTRRESYAIGTCPAGVRFLTCGVDVQKDRLVYEVVGWGRDRESWSVDAGILPGRTADLQGGPWPALDALLGRHFPHAFGVDLPITMLAIDSGYETQTIYTWAHRHPVNRVIAVKGHDAAKVLIGSPSTVAITAAGKQLKRGYKVWPVSPNLAKSELYGWLGLALPTDETPAPPGFCHFPEYGEDFFKELTGEQLVEHKSGRGFTVYAWEVIPGRSNHWLDARVYARCAAALVGLDRFRDRYWAALEATITAAADRIAPKPDRTYTPAPAPPTPPAPKPGTRRVTRSRYIR